MGGEPLSTAGERTALLDEMVKLNQHTIEKQLESMSQVHAKNEQSIGFGLALLAAGPTALAFLTDEDKDGVGGWSLGLLAVAAIALLAGVLWLIASGLMQSSQMATGPSARWLKEKSEDETWTLAELRLSLLSAFPEYIAMNRREMERGVRRRQMGVALLVLGAVVFSIAFIRIMMEAV